MEKTFYQNPNIDFLFGYIAGAPVPTKQDKFKPISVLQKNEDGTEEVLENFYIRKPNDNALLEFTNYIQDMAKGQFLDGKKILKPNEIEVILSISATEKRYRTVDVDNLAKAVLDALNGIAYEDDSQVASLICDKFIHPLKVNSILIGITILSAENPGFRNRIKLYSSTPY